MKKGPVGETLTGVVHQPRGTTVGHWATAPTPDPLLGGRPLLEGEQIVCACHGSRFDLTDGSLRHGPATAPRPAFEARDQAGFSGVTWPRWNSALSDFATR
jgi:Rieske [2Fe-2S] domain